MIINDRINSIIRLEWLIENFADLGSRSVESRELFSKYRGVDLLLGVCHHAQLRDCTDLIRTFIRGSDDKENTLSITFPIGGHLEYNQSGNLYKNPRRKEFMYWMKDSLTWELSLMDRIMLRIARPFYKNRVNLWD